ncbi:MAG TPA: DUF4070 domain-containing protein, partial [Frankiaceae bacterium]|nr:DUF4070 domain-containing protein [Frankiaceae bacterium]
ARIFARYGRQARETWPHRKPLPAHSPRRSRADLIRGARIAAHVTWEVGIRSGYRMAFWRLVAEAVRAGQPEVPIQAGIVAHDLIRYTRDAVAGRAARAFYAPPATGPSSAAARGIDAVRS